MNIKFFVNICNISILRNASFERRNVNIEGPRLT